MLTFFTTAKAFKDHSGIIQRNALKSWKLLYPDAEVILFGDEPGAADVCREMGLRHEPRVERDESGLKYVDYMFSRAQEIARHPYLCYSNCDMIFMNDFRDGFERVSAKKRSFLLVGSRWDTGVTKPLDFNSSSWAQELRQYTLTSGLRQMHTFIDFFVFPRGFYDHVPRLVVGRWYWDQWLVWKALAKPAPVVDGTEFFIAVHQNHDYGYHPQGQKGTGEDPLAMRNKALAGDGRELRTLLDVTHKLTRWGSIRRVFFRRQISERRVAASLQFAMDKTFGIRKRLGLRRQTFSKLSEKIHRRADEIRDTRKPV
jgi:hypothetical protein